MIEHASAAARRIAALRVAVGALFLVRTAPAIFGLGIGYAYDVEPVLGWPAPGATLAWLPAGAIEALVVVRTLCALSFMLGFFARPTGLVSVACTYLVLAQYPDSFFFTLHLMAQAMLALALVDSSAHFAVRRVPAASLGSSLMLLRCWIASIYAWAGSFKLRADWLDGRTLELFHHRGAIEGALADALLSTAAQRALVAQGVCALELLLGPLLLLRRTRTAAVVVAYAFHVTLELTAHPDLLGVTMMALLVVFVPFRK